MTIAFSLLQLVESKSIGFREPLFSYTNGNLSLSAPFYINNTGFYDLSDINITVLVKGDNKTVAAVSELFPPIPAGSMINESYDISLSLGELFSKNSELLTHDTTLDLNMHLFFRIAYLIGIGGSTNITTVWGAPFYNLTLAASPYNYSSHKLTLFMSFENHAYFDLNGAMRLELYSSTSALIGSPTQNLDIPSDTLFDNSYELTIDTFKITHNGTMRVYFDNMLIQEAGVILT
jgi:hypothetical protein